MALGKILKLVAEADGVQTQPQQVQEEMAIHLASLLNKDITAVQVLLQTQIV